MCCSGKRCPCKCFFKNQRGFPFVEFLFFKGLFTLKIKWLSFTYLHVIPNLCDFALWNTKWDVLKNAHTVLLHTMKVDDDQGVSSSKYDHESIIKVVPLIHSLFSKSPEVIWYVCVRNLNWKDFSQPCYYSFTL